MPILYAKIISILRLTRPANVVTAIADILAGAAVAYSSNAITQIEFVNLLCLVLSTAGLYGGGIVLNDVFDAELDRIERPERPIPKGDISLASASLFAVTLYAGAIFSAFLVSFESGLIAILIALLATFYDKYGKHINLVGPFSMGACRAANLMLGISILPDRIFDNLYLILLPLLFIAGITFISKGEVQSATRSHLSKALVMFILAVSFFVYLSNREDFFLIQAMPFIAIFLINLLPALIAAFKTQEPLLVRMAVKRGVISIVILDAALGAGFYGIFYGVIILALWPISVLLAKTFAVT